MDDPLLERLSVEELYHKKVVISIAFCYVFMVKCC